ncbi:MAG: tRNA-(ms[2]io[6]A)-hydroxylase [Candidatus Azotimanducaceae bacterium]
MYKLMNINKFLFCSTPSSWLEAAKQNIPTLLIDHANCEKKAASTALNLIYRYVDKPKLLLQMSKLAREELRHFEQVVTLINKRNLDYTQLSSSRYAGELRKSVRTFEPARLLDTLIVSAIVEARSCERFASLAPLLEDDLSRFYSELLKSEERHFRVYLDLAETISEGFPLEERIEFFLEEDCRLIQTEDADFRFHSGVPMAKLYN